jgi:hypothetical protein
MPASINSPSIPVPNGNNTQQVLQAIRNYIIAQGNTDASRATLQGGMASQNPIPSPSQFIVTTIVYNSVTFAVSGATGPAPSVTIPVLQLLELTNPVTGQTWQLKAPGKSTTGGTVGTAL